MCQNTPPARYYNTDPCVGRWGVCARLVTAPPCQTQGDTRPDQKPRRPGMRPQLRKQEWDSTPPAPFPCSSKSKCGHIDASLLEYLLNRSRVCQDIISAIPLLIASVPEYAASPLLQHISMCWQVGCLCSSGDGPALPTPRRYQARPQTTQARPAPIAQRTGAGFNTSSSLPMFFEIEM